MVRLKAHPLGESYLSKRAFQFHYGTIKSGSSSVRNESSERFQFHYGTIKSISNLSSSAYSAEFQFHYGTIKSTYIIVKVLHLLYFNSIMVRLKVTKGIL